MTRQIQRVAGQLETPRRPLLNSEVKEKHPVQLKPDGPSNRGLRKKDPDISVASTYPAVWLDAVVMESSDISDTLSLDRKIEVGSPMISFCMSSYTDSACLAHKVHLY